MRNVALVLLDAIKEDDEGADHDDDDDCDDNDAIDDNEAVSVILSP